MHRQESPPSPSQQGCRRARPPPSRNPETPEIGWMGPSLAEGRPEDCRIADNKSRNKKSARGLDKLQMAA
ncbi:hypothetical protein Cob_v005050 [Colletotrichum orbiculare MAFF 240422]|uniref:Uncharacterized protein n=1 Tax=Colletotrichum orbiculare (strain 104-T / ATCC 96160 / CBS 514.97 / LARS 414 / MAFF 240422) TaxID=1213857 RepID=A0A484FW91_COLOR|nr:hypothetical protein Cob_v005050 [Colletotrichum orbiculare MAFF 240422]